MKNLRTPLALGSVALTCGILLGVLAPTAAVYADDLVEAPVVDAPVVEAAVEAPAVNAPVVEAAAPSPAAELHADDTASLTASLNFSVYREGTANPVQDGVVEWFLAADPTTPVRTSTLGINGFTFISGLQAGDYLVRITAPGYETEWWLDAASATTATVLEVDGSAGSTFLGSTYLTPDGSTPVVTSAKISGYVLDRHGEPLVGAHVDILTPAGDLVQRVDTQLFGYYLAEGLPFGSYVVRASHDGYVAEFSGDVVALEDAQVWEFAADDVVSLSNLVFDLVATVEVSGRVVDPSGAPVAGVAVTLTDQYGAISSATTDADGRWIVDALLDGDYRIFLDVDEAATGLRDQWWAGQWTQGGSDVVEVEAGSGELHLEATLYGAPTADDDLYFKGFDQQLVVTHHWGLLANDSGWGDLTVVDVQDGPAHGDLDIHADGSFEYLPDPGFVGVDSVTYRTQDAAGGVSEPATVRIVIVGADFDVEDDAYATPRDTAVAGNVLDNDPDLPGIEVYVWEQPEHGSVVLAGDGSFTYVPEPGFVGVDVFEYQAFTPGGAVSNGPGEVVITVTEPTVAAEEGDGQLDTLALTGAPLGGVAALAAALLGGGAGLAAVRRRDRRR